ncbi:conserved hypothetical protein [Echinococcus multilocularis]|uniref:Protein rolling stone n=1 Tax=Echinococcus multilocularis TaxID=6211 RepID=A0A087VZI8_ECHMU|nr:conserved hypothetical protein [Echinococcus multilocularis]
MDGAVYTSFRFVIATALVTWLGCEIPFEFRHLGDKPMLLWFTYATEWAFIILTLTSVGFAAFCVYYRLNKDRMNSVVGDRILWFFFTISANTIITTSGIYWITFWDRDYVYFFKLTSKVKHSIPALLVIIDMFVNNMPIRLVHCVYPLVVGIFYGLFTYVYWLSGSGGFIGNGIIYPIINWNRPGFAIGACILALLFCCIIQVFLYLLYFARTYLSYLVEGRGVQTFQLLCPEGSDEGHLLAQEAADLLETERATAAAKSYSSLE